MNKMLAITAILFTSMQVNATIWCVGTVKDAWISSAGDVYVHMSYRNNHTRICNINSVLNNVTPAVCEQWYKTILTAQATERNMTLQYNDYTCATLPTYGNAPTPNYVMLR